MRTEGSRKAIAFSVVVFTLFGGYFAYAASMMGKPANVPFVQPVTASDEDRDVDSLKAE